MSIIDSCCIVYFSLQNCTRLVTTTTADCSNETNYNIVQASSKLDSALTGNSRASETALVTQGKEYESIYHLSILIISLIYFCR